MPGVYEKLGENCNGTTVEMEDRRPNERETMEDEQSNHLGEQTNQENVRELTQTDRINRHLLKSFLEHINSQSIKLPVDELETEDDPDNDADW